MLSLRGAQGGRYSSIFYMSNGLPICWACKRIPAKHSHADRTMFINKLVLHQKEHSSTDKIRKRKRDVHINNLYQPQVWIFGR